MKKVPVKNYILYLIIIIVTIFLTILLSYEYKKHINNKDTKRVVNISEITEYDLYEIIVENDNFVIYLSNSKDFTIEETEKELNEYLYANNLTNNIVYIDLSKVQENFNETLKNTLNITQDIDFTSSPNMILVEDETVTDILYENNEELNIESVKHFLTGRIND